MTKFEATCYSIKSQVEDFLAQRAVRERDFDPFAEESIKEAHEALLHEATAMAVGILARMYVINDARNDQAQTSARELLVTLGKRLTLDMCEQLGLPLDSEVQ